MDIVLLGLSKPRLQHLGSALRQMLASLHQPVHLHIPDDAQTFEVPPPQTRVLLCVSPLPDDNSAAWRQHLLSIGLPFQVIHSSDQDLLAPCLLALLPAETAQGLSRQPLPVRWQGVCETCSDPDCELRLFSGLLQSR